MENEITSSTAPRGARRRERTRASLVAAARELIAERGIDAVRINEITERADVGFGSFYNHFADKDAVVMAVLEVTIGAHAKSVEALSGGVVDPAEVLSVAHRYFIRVAGSDPTWAWIVVRLDVTHQVLATALAPHALRDIEAGTDAGRFNVPDVGAALTMMGGALVASMKTVLDNTAPERIDEIHAQMVLRMLGIEPSEAAEIARRPLPDVVGKL